MTYEERRDAAAYFNYTKASFAYFAIVDRTKIPLQERPRYANHKSFIDRKKRYSIH